MAFLHSEMGVSAMAVTWYCIMQNKLYYATLISNIYAYLQGRIQDLAMGGGGKILSIAHTSVADHLRGFPEATIKVYTWIF